MTDSLRARIQKAMADTGLTNPHDLAKKLVSDLTEEEIVNAVAAYIRIAMGNTRRSAVSSVPQASAKVTAVQTWYERLLDESVDVGGDSGNWKRLADCTRDEVLAVAKFRRDQAARSIEMAKKFEALAKEMKAGQTVSDLDAEKVRKAMT